MGPEKPVCIQCGALPPPTFTNYTLISQKHGWRLILDEIEPGKRIPKWWCPACWARHKENRKPAKG